MSDINAAISEFLATKGIDAHAPETSRLGRAAAVGAITALTPVGGLAYGAVKARGNQGEAMAWQSWQQWALSQPDWPEFYANEWPRIVEERKEEARRIQEQMIERMQGSQKEEAALLGIGIVTFIAIAFIGSIAAINNQTFSPSSASYVEQVR